MIDRVELKTNAKKCLKNNFLDCVAVVLLASIVSYLVKSLIPDFGYVYRYNKTTINFTAEFANLIIYGLFSLGYSSFFLKLSRGEKVEIKEFWSKTNLFIPYLVISILTAVFVFLWSLLFIIPGIIAALSYSMVYFVKLDNPDMSEIDALKRSKEIMNNHKLDYLVLLLSFIGWQILSILTFGILSFYVTPYMELTICNFYNEIKELS